uniref:FAD:protein FMN transferase n=1 Tax=uncultured bacterium 878 TaxID=548895 RepID=B8R8N2_9BACT|nr:putative NosX protein [uncultured bacterium 878]
MGTTMRADLTRRRVISILAAGVALPAFARGARAGNPEPFRWQGIVLGAAADLTLYAADRAQAGDALAAALAEIARLEGIFSLYQPDSALSRLNREGRLDAAPFELRELLSQAIQLAAASHGRFEPTIQPLWKLLADHFAGSDADPAGPSAAKLAAVRAVVDYRAVRFGEGAIVFDRPGMQVTLNGIAQGYISDRIGALLKQRGFSHALVNLGEALAIDRRPDGGAWTIGVPAPDDRAHLVTKLEIAGGAVATSAGRGMTFDASGRFNHIIDPQRLVCADPDRSITVLAPSAAIADGLSTLGALLPDPRRDLPPHLAAFGARAFVYSTRGNSIDWI